MATEKSVQKVGQLFNVPERSFTYRYSFLLISNKFCDCVAASIGTEV